MPGKNKITLTKDTADPHLLYEHAVQDADLTIAFIDSVFDDEHDREPLSLREDFCGTAKLCSEWVRRGGTRTAVGLDIDVPTLAWARQHNIGPLKPDEKRRVELKNRDVLVGTAQQFEVIVAFNFSYWVFHQRKVLKDYFAKVRSSIKPGGAFMLDLHSGPDSQFQLEEAFEYDEFDYVWEQESFNPYNNHTVCHIHFRLPNGDELQRAFTYDWRVWSLPELRDLLEEVGFVRVDEWWDGSDDDTMVRLEPENENFMSWLAYLVAWV
jgi:cyclopropane fatty-acyl-phospholipid synthase-like methyltransferase